MQNSKNVIIALVLVLAVLSLGYYLTLTKSTYVPPAQTPPQQTPSTTKPTPTPAGVVYSNTEYGFSFDLPATWKGYTLVVNSWEGRNTDTGNVVETGPLIKIRHPLYTGVGTREDMPVMVFTLSQWDKINNENIVVSAAPVAPSVLGQNSKYVLALPARYNFDYSTGWEEVDKLVHTLKTFAPVDKLVCGGIAGFSCPTGYSCEMKDTYPDAMGTCIKD